MTQQEGGRDDGDGHDVDFGAGVAQAGWGETSSHLKTVTVRREELRSLRLKTLEQT